MASPILAAIRFVLATFSGGGVGLALIKIFVVRLFGGISAASTGSFYTGGHVVITTHRLDSLLPRPSLRIRNTTRRLIAFT
jgi:hypothetical protein